jgi:hypothetical protein
MGEFEAKDRSSSYLSETHSTCDVQASTVQAPTLGSTAFEPRVVSRNQIVVCTTSQSRTQAYGDADIPGRYGL